MEAIMSFSLAINSRSTDQIHYSLTPPTAQYKQTCSTLKYQQTDQQPLEKKTKWWREGKTKQYEKTQDDSNRY